MQEPQQVTIAEPIKLGFKIGFGFFLFSLLVSIPLGAVGLMWLADVRYRAALMGY